jgi:hypothetical protein
MEKTKFLTIFPTFENLKVVKETLPTVIEETQKNDAKLIVHDSSEKYTEKKWAYLKKMNKNRDFFLILSDNLSMAHARNMCLRLGQEMYAPDYICMLEDDHGFKPGLISAMIKAMDTYYGQISPIGLRFGLFTGCGIHYTPKQRFMDDNNVYPDGNNEPMLIGKANSCFRCAPTNQWINVLKGYDTDEYLISKYQTQNLNYRNYHKGFTSMLVQNGELTFYVDNKGRGTTSEGDKKLWHDKYTASDPRSRSE